jgi:hypothetical protein
MNPATALHEVLSSVASKSTRLDLAWAEVLEAEYGSSEFARRHAEVSQLAADCFRLTDGMSDERRARSLKFASAWWSALVAPLVSWQATQAPAFMPAAEIHHLALLGDVFEEIYPSTEVTPDSTQLAGLRGECERWLQALDTFTSVPLGTRRLLQADLRHLVWLIDRVNLLGVTRVAHESQAVTTQMVMAVQKVSDPTQQADWFARAQTFFSKVAALMLATSLTMTPALYASAQLLEQVNNNIDQVADVLDGPEPPKELPDEAPRETS